MNARAALIWLALAAPAAAQGFAGLGGDAEGFALPDPAYRMQFPADHGPHPEFRIEWWYLTANLTTPDGTPHGLQWTLFRTALAPGEAGGWTSPQIWFGHAAVTSAGFHHAAERFARGGTGQAGVTAAPFAAWIDDWEMSGDPEGAMRLSASAPGFAYALSMQATGPLVLQGQQGYSVKSPQGQASHYYSQPHLQVSGRITLPSRDIPVTGTAWLDREWSSQPLSGDQTGWDWFSLSFESGEKLMGFRLRAQAGPDFTAATWIAPDGTPVPMADGALIAEPLDRAEVAGRLVPVRWRLRLSARGLDVTVAALNPQAWMDLTIPYWEGPVTVSGSHAGRGYLEMTGYAP